MTVDFYKEQLNAKEEMLAQTTRFLVNIQEQLEEKNHKLTSVNKDIFDSIEFATLIQQSLLPDVGILKIFFKDAGYRVMQQIGIGGDNIFIKTTNKGVMFGLLDSTGHGIPAALLSISGTVILKELIYSMEINSPKPLLQLLNQQLYNTFNNSGYKMAQQEGAIFHYCSSEHKLNYCSARGKGFICDPEGRVKILESSKKSIGEDLETHFELFKIDLIPGSKLVIYSDGFPDQFGGEYNKKFSSKRLIKLLEENGNKNANELCNLLELTFKNWKGDKPQTDDTSFIVIEF